MSRPGRTDRVRWPSRRSFARSLLHTMAWLPFAQAAWALLRRTGAGRPLRQVRVTPDFRDGFAFGGEVVVHACDDGGLVAFSTRCSHLGCRISRVDDGHLVCPCHGSRFRHDGSVASGPATQPLQRLAASPDSASGFITVDV